MIAMLSIILSVFGFMFNSMFNSMFSSINMTNKVDQPIMAIKKEIKSNDEKNPKIKLYQVSPIKSKDIEKSKDYNLSNDECSLDSIVSMDKFESLEFKTYPFSYIVREGSKRYRKITKGEYSNDPQDKACWYNGKLIGSCKSVGAPALAKYLGGTVTVSDMKNISIETATAIYEKIYKTDMNGHLIKVHNPILLDIMFNAICSSWGKKHIRQCISKIDKNYSKTHNGDITEEEVQLLNNIFSNIQNEAKFYKYFYNIRVNFYSSCNKHFSGLKKWIKDYPTPENYLKTLE